MTMNRRIAQLIGSLAFGALAVGSSACVIRESPGVNRGYGYGYAQAGTQGGIMVGTPSPYYVNSMPPEPLYETMTTSPGYGYVWIDGYWNWNGYEWVWANGHWVTEQQGYVYVQPYYDWDSGGRNVYYPGHWSRPEHVDSRVRVVDHRDGRPSTGYYPTPSRDRPTVVDHRGSSGGGTVGGSGHTSGGSTNDHRGNTSGGGTTTGGGSSHDHRGDSGGGTTSNDHRGDGGTTTTPPPAHDHRGQGGTVKPPPPPARDTSDHRGGGTTTTRPSTRVPQKEPRKAPATRPNGDNVKAPPARKAPQESPKNPKRSGGHDHRHSSITSMASGTTVAMASGTQYDMMSGTTLLLK
jgi:hypothetical protein